MRREEILAAAVRVIRKHGAARARVEDVVREARAAKGTLYLYFDSWEALLIALRARIFAEFDTRFPIVAIVGDVSWPRRIEILLGGFFDFVLSLGKLHEAVFHGAIAHLPAPPQTTAAYRISLFIHAGIDAGAFAAVDPEPTARLLFAAIHEAVDAIEAGESRERLLRVTTALVCRALGCAVSADISSMRARSSPRRKPSRNAPSSR